MNSLIEQVRKETAALLDTLDAALPKIDNCLVMSQIHGCKYDGPQIDTEPCRAALRRLDALQAADGDADAEFLIDLSHDKSLAGGQPERLNEIADRIYFQQLTQRRRK